MNLGGRGMTNKENGMDSYGAYPQNTSPGLNPMKFSPQRESYGKALNPLNNQNNPSYEPIQNYTNSPGRYNLSNMNNGPLSPGRK